MVRGIKSQGVRLLSRRRTGAQDAEMPGHHKLVAQAVDSPAEQRFELISLTEEVRFAVCTYLERVTSVDASDALKKLAVDPVASVADRARALLAGGSA